jgi:hypothetical protein
MEIVIKKIAVAAFSLIFLLPAYTSYCIWKSLGEKAKFIDAFESYGDAGFCIVLALLGVFIFCALVF